MKVIITGINGFIGRSLYSFFKTCPDYQIIGIEQPKYFFNTKSLLYSWDELDKIGQADCIIHLAGLAHDTNNTKLEDEYYKVNTELTKTIFNFFLTSQVQKFIFFSSVKAVSDFSDIPLVETLGPKPGSIYGKSKLIAEKFILANLPDDGRKIYILRPCMIHGPGNKGNLNILYNFVQNRIPWPLGLNKSLRSFASIDNVNFIIKELIERDIESGIYNVADDESLSTNEMIGLMGLSLDRKTRIWNIPFWMIHSMAWLGDKGLFPLTNDRLNKLKSSYIVSNEKIKSALGIIEMPIKARDGIMRTLNSFNSSGK